MALHMVKLHVTMKGSKSAKSSREKVRKHRQRLREQGLRPIQIWVPDVRSPKFAAECRRQSRLIARSEGEKEDQAFIDAISDWGNW